jgi:hypothetical protein
MPSCYNQVKLASIYTEISPTESNQHLSLLDLIEKDISNNLCKDRFVKCQTHLRGSSFDRHEILYQQRQGQAVGRCAAEIPQEWVALRLKMKNSQSFAIYIVEMCTS